MTADYEENGYFVIRNFLGETELQGLREVVTNFHLSWKEKNARLYAEKAINSSGLTAAEHLNTSEREALFRFIGSARLMNMVTAVMDDAAAFMNTQLFFDPFNEEQRNYWHRDPQYHLSLDEQKEALTGPSVVHFRIPLVDEPGVDTCE